MSTITCTNASKEIAAILEREIGGKVTATLPGGIEIAGTIEGINSNGEIIISIDPSSIIRQDGTSGPIDSNRSIARDGTASRGSRIQPSTT